MHFLILLVYVALALIYGVFVLFWKRWRNTSMYFVKTPMVIVGPSGVGKGTLTKRILERFPGAFTKVVPHTTRKRRQGEEDGVDYHFVDEKYFKENEFLYSGEHHGCWYGMTRKSVTDISANNGICILDVGLEGLEQCSKSGVATNSVFVTLSGDMNEKMDTLRTRLRERGSETEDQLSSRMKDAERMFAFLEHSPDALSCIIANDDLEVATNELFKQLQSWYPSLVDVECSNSDVRLSFDIKVN